MDDPKKSLTSPKQWLADQLKPLQYENDSWTSEKAIQELSTFYQEKKNQKKAGKETTSTMTGRKRIVNKSILTAVDTVVHAIKTELSFQARLLDFFSNHFSVSSNNLKMQALAPTLEREAIAPRLSGSFADLLIAVESHPAMITYLNNEQSAGPDSWLGKRKKHRGINENLAREILELHTLGVDGGYTQKDVGQLALAITGWSVGTPGRGEFPGFKFRNALHQPGHKMVMGKTYSQTGVEQGKHILQDIAVHPSTARFVSFKLARHFIADHPHEKLVKDISDTWLASGGDIPTVVTHLIDHPLSWLKEQRKFKTPREFVISSCRACGKRSGNRMGLFTSLVTLGQRPFNAGSPAGYGDTRDEWDGGEALIKRIEWADKFSSYVTYDPGEMAGI
ncbi:MAG: DUF1800 domain-containing protein, partial [Chlorobiales bacterium]|nr:DUF1800 domain-containing protein [Chlorobiales bacterium]